jgi:hypothetical protein
MTGRPAGAAGIRTNRSPATTKLAGPPPSPCSRTTQNARANTKVISITTQRRSSHTHTPITGRWSFRSRWAGAEPAGIMHSFTTPGRGISNFGCSLPPVGRPTNTAASG